MTVSQAVEEFLTYFSSVKGMSENSVNAYRNDLENFCAMEFIGKERPIGEITENDILSCIGVLSAKKRKSTSINRFISSVRSLFLYCRNFGYIDVNPASEIKNVKVPATLPNFMTGNEVDEICRQPLEKEILWAARDNAIFEMFYSSGCRISELAALKTGDFLKDLSSAVVHGKGGKDRRVFFSKDAVESLKNYIIEKDSRFGSFTLKDRNAFIFVNQRGTALSARGIRFILSKYSGPEGTKRHINPHAFRHTFATALISNGADVRLVQELLGHSSISTTQRYTHISTDRLIEMYNKSHPHGDKKNN